MNTISNQELFDKVAKHLLAQGCAATNPEGQCRYLTADGRKCAVGCLITRGNYDPDLEGCVVNDNNVITAVENSLGCGLTLDNLDILAELQKIHDRIDESEWVNQLKSLAVRYQLDTAVVDNHA